MYIKSNNEARSCNNSCSGKAINITYSENVFVALGSQHATRVRHIFICCLSSPEIFFHVISSKERFSKKNNLLNFEFVLIFIRMYFSYGVEENIWT